MHELTELTHELAERREQADENMAARIDDVVAASEQADMAAEKRYRLMKQQLDEELRIRKAETAAVRAALTRLRNELMPPSVATMKAESSAA